MSATDLKAQGNAAYAANDYKKAVRLFSQAIDADDKNQVLFSNRSAAYASLGEFQNALDDAEKCVELKSDWSKAWSRKGAALHGLGRLSEAIDAYKEGQKLDPENVQIQAGLSAAEKALENSKPDNSSGNTGAGNGAGGDIASTLKNLLGGGAGAGNGAGGDFFSKMMSMAGDPSIRDKIMNNPQLAKIAQDPKMREIMDEVQKNPMSLLQNLSDPKYQEVMQTLMGSFSGLASGFGGANNSAGAGTNDSTEDSHMAESDEQGTPNDRDTSNEREELNDSAMKKPSEKTEVKEQAEDDSPITNSSLSDKAQAAAEKTAGNAAYKQKDFANAIAHYSRAWELHKDITYLNNLAAAYLEAGDFEACIREAKRAVDEGREQHADYALIAKAYNRIGTAYHKQGNLELAIENFQKSITEHRSADSRAKLRECEKEKAEQDRMAYISPEEAEKERLSGNEHFKAGDFPKAIKSYTEMTKRAPQDPRGFANRAAAYIKVMSFRNAIQDCDKTLELDPLFVKAYIRKAQAYMGLKNYSDALEVLEQASKADEDPKNAKKSLREIQDMMYNCTRQMYTTQSAQTEEDVMKNIQNDSELATLLQDPVMRSILQQAQQEPKALQEHMKNPKIRAGILKLIQAGVIRTG